MELLLSDWRASPSRGIMVRRLPEPAPRPLSASSWASRSPFSIPLRCTALAVRAEETRPRGRKKLIEKRTTEADRRERAAMKTKYQLFSCPPPGRLQGWDPMMEEPIEDKDELE